MRAGEWVYLNGEILRSDLARISPFDRGYLFAQAAYEVTAVYNGQLIDFEAHLARLSQTLKGIDILPPEIDLVTLHHALMAKNHLVEGLVYLQISGGEHGPRDFYGPEELTPTVFAFVTHKKLMDSPAETGITAISAPDTRWGRRDLKTTQLLSQSLAYRAARRAGAHTAILHEDGCITEAASANLWMVQPDGVLITRDLSQALLAGITRQTLLRLLQKAGFAVHERAFTLAELKTASEAFTSSTGLLIAPLTHLDDSAIGCGTPGPVVRQVQRLYYDYMGADPDQIGWL